MKQPLSEINIHSPHYSKSMAQNRNRFFSEHLRAAAPSKPHYHNCYELELVLSGRAVQHLDGEPYSLARGSVTLISPLQIHSIDLPTEPIELISIKINPAILPTDLKERLERQGKAVVGQLQEAQLAAVVAMYTAIEKGGVLADSDSPLQTDAVTYQLFSLLLFVLDRFGAEQTESGHADAAGSFLQVVAYIKTNLTAPLTLKRVAEQFGYTPNYFSSKFKAMTGKSFVSFVRDERLVLAYRIICCSEQSVQQVAMDCGFASFAYFSRAFKKKFGKAPSAFRGTAR